MLNENIKRLRLELGKPQNQVADELGIKRTTYSNYETGLREPNAETLISISKYFGVTIDYLLDVEQINEYTNEEIMYIKKCRKIDKKGISIIKQTIDSEYERCKEIEILEKDLIEHYLGLTDSQRKAVLDFMQRCIDKGEAQKQAREEAKKSVLTVKNQALELDEKEKSNEQDEETLKTIIETEEKRAKALSALENYDTVVIETTTDKVYDDLQHFYEENAKRKDII